LPPEQLGLPQLVLDVGIQQVGEAPSHLPAHSPVPPHELRAGVPPVRGAPLTRMHLPSVPISLHERHCSVHSELQQ
jgi:hypothetical protein